MKKLFISCPMTGRTQDNIKATIKKMHKIAEAYVGEDLEVINTFDPALKGNPLLGISRSLELMQDADYFIGPTDNYLWNGCYMEAEAFARYKGGDKMIRVSVEFIAPDAYKALHEAEEDKYPVRDVYPVHKEF